MNRQRQYNTQATQHQRGAVAIIVALCLTLLVGMLGLVLDLGHLYVAKTELQNAADAAALSGAKALNGTQGGVIEAFNRAIETAGRNKYDLNARVVTLTADNLWVGSCPDDGTCTMVQINTVTSATAANKTFLKVDTRPGTGTVTGIQNLNTWFIKVLPGATTTTQTFGMAVAGIYSYPVVPLGICKLPHDFTDITMKEEDLGYKRGVTYRLSDANPICPGTMYWIDPVNVTDTNTGRQNACDGSTSGFLPYVCAGRVNFKPQVGQWVYTNTGISVPQLDALDSRFNIYTNNAKCSPLTAPPDANIKSYAFNGSGGGQPKDWMNFTPIQQSITFGVYGCNSDFPYFCTNLCSNGGKGKDLTIGLCKLGDTLAFDGKPVTVQYRPKPFLVTPLTSTPTYTADPTKAEDYGVLWSASRPVGVVNDWSILYKTLTAAPINPFPSPSPYKASVPYYEVVTGGNTGVPDRRMLNITMLNCTSSTSCNGSCDPVQVVGIGKFFLQRLVAAKLDNAGKVVNKDVYLEYAGLQPAPLPPDDIRLYR